MKSDLCRVFSARYRLYRACLLSVVLCASADSAVIDDFSGDLSAYTLSRVNDNNTAANVSFGITDGVLRASYAGSSTYEQVLLLRDDYTLNIGDTLLAEMTQTGADWDRDLGIAVGYSKTPPALAVGSSGDVRTNYVEISYRSNNQVMTYGRNGTTNLPSGQAWISPVDALFIRRTGLRDFVLGCILNGTATIVSTYSITNDPVIGDAVGFYADVRAAVSLSPTGFHNLQIIRPVQLYFTPEGQPANTAVLEDHNAAFSAEFISDEIPTVAWYRFADGAWNVIVPQGDKYEIEIISDSESSLYRTTLHILNAATPDEGLYFCGIEAPGAVGVQTEPAMLAIKRLIAHWTLNAGDYSSGVHLDKTAGYGLASPEAASFVTGAAGISEAALRIGTGASSEPVSSLFDNGLTVSIWGRSDQSGTLTFSDRIHSLNGATLEAAQWKHVCLVFDGQSAQSFVNGQSAGQQAWPLSATYEMVLELGHASGESFFAGTVDDVRLYNCSLTPEEVYELYARRTGDAGCVLDYAYALDLSGPDGWPDCRINLHDFAVKASQWLDTENQAAEFADLMALADEWLGCGLDKNCL